jgi:hypothetical protein
MINTKFRMVVTPLRKEEALINGWGTQGLQRADKILLLKLGTRNTGAHLLLYKLHIQRCGFISVSKNH